MFDILGCSSSPIAFYFWGSIQQAPKLTLMSVIIPQGLQIWSPIMLCMVEFTNHAHVQPPWRQVFLKTPCPDSCYVGALAFAHQIIGSQNILDVTRVNTLRLFILLMIQNFVESNVFLIFYLFQINLIRLFIPGAARASGQPPLLRRRRAALVAFVGRLLLLVHPPLPGRHPLQPRLSRPLNPAPQFRKP